ncbi:hypothetical protein BDY24DRAFT_413322 [Mrakia frigida]|uniref:uncharacterized protein n=1 Tax=Mrakia frigida TaxID=29902 RepID=UPI003FCBF9AF
MVSPPSPSPPPSSIRPISPLPSPPPPFIPRSRILDDSLPSLKLEPDFDSDSDELFPPPAHPSRPSSPQPASDSSGSEDDSKKRKLYVRKKPVLGPAGEKKFLTEGIYSSSTSQRPPSLLLPPPPPTSKVGSKPPPQPAHEETKKSKRFKPYVGYETILPDGRVVEGKLDLHAPVQLDAEMGSSTVEPEAEISARDARSRLRTRMSLPATLPPPPPPAPAPTPSHTTNFVQIVSLPVASLAPLPPSGGVLNGTRSRPRASLPSLPSFSQQPKASTSAPPPPTGPPKPFSFPLPNPFCFPLPQPSNLLRHRKDFALPYDIRWEVENGSIKRKKKENVPGKYVKLAQNTFPERGKDMDPTGPAICSCVLPKGKNEEGMMQYLCHPKTCPCGDRCSNKSLYKRKSPDIKIFWTGNRGFGLQAVEKIPKGTFVIDYRGEIIEISTYYDRILTDYAGRNDYYALEYGEGEVIDAGQKGNAARFINHGCSPNLEVHKLTTLGSGVEEYEVGLWSSRDILPGEELFYDYNFDSFGDRPSKKPSKSSPTNLEPSSPTASSSTLVLPAVLAKAPGNGRQRCNCGARACTGWIGGSAPAANSSLKGKEKEKEMSSSGGGKSNGAGKAAKKAKGKGKAALLVAAVAAKGKGGGKKGKGRDAVRKSKLGGAGGAGGKKGGTLKVKGKGGKK